MTRPSPRFQLLSEPEPETQAPPHEAIPPVPQRLPLLSNEWRQLRALLDQSLSVSLEDGDMKVLCYLLRRAHGMGYREGRASA